MAKWGEGDPRWIVEDRPDATNVNNWHWTEKNAGPWSKDRLKELLVGLDLSSSEDRVSCKLTDMEKIKGEASANNRKGKLIFFYEWKMKIAWEGRLEAGSGELIKGHVEIPNLSEENGLDDIEITVTVKENTDESLRVKEFMHKIARDKIRSQLDLYVSSLREEFSKGMILPKKDGKVSLKPDTISNITSGFNKKIDMSPVVKNSTDVKSTAGVKLDVENIELKHKFQCRAQEFYDAMTKIEMVMAFTKGDAKVEAEKGGKFILFGGNISGHFVNLVPAKKIVQQWRYKRWPESHLSTVTIDISQEADHTLVSLKQIGVPKCDVEMTKQNWERYYWESIKRTFGFGAFF